MDADSPTPPEGESVSDAQDYQQIARERFLRTLIEQLGDRIQGVGHFLRDDEISEAEAAEQLERSRAEAAVILEWLNDE